MKKTDLLRVLVTGAVVVVVGACGDLVPQEWSCDFRPGNAICNDTLTNPNNQLSPTWENLCSLGDGTYKNGELCDTTGTLGGCECEGCENGHTISWFFEGADGDTINTVEDVQARCEAEGREFVPAP